MRLRMLALFLVAALTGKPALGAPDLHVIITAQQIALYSDRGLLVADGGVNVRLPQGRISATRLVYDFRANVLRAEGDVSATDANGVTTTGVGYVYDVAKLSGAMVPHADVPQLSTNEALATAQQADVQSAKTITLTNAAVQTGGTFIPTATYTFAIPPPNAKDFGSSPVPSAALEYAFLLANGQDAYTFARTRYDHYNGGPGLGLEEHFARSDRGYVAIGETDDIDGGRFDVNAYERVNKSLTQTFSASSLIGERIGRYTLAQSGREGYSSLTFAQFDGSRSDDLFATGNLRRIGSIGSFRFQGDLGHDVHPDPQMAQDVRANAGIHVDTATVHLDRRGTLSASADVGETVYGYGRGAIASDLSFWSTLPVTSKFQLDGGASFAHAAPLFASTSRTYTVGEIYNPGPFFALTSSLQYTNDFGQAFNSGRPQFSAAFDVAVRRRNGTGIEVGAILPFGRVGNFHNAAGLNLRLLR